MINSAYEPLLQNTQHVWLAVATITAGVLIQSILHVFFNGKRPKGLGWAPSRAQGPLAAFQSAVACTTDFKRTLLKSNLHPRTSEESFLISNVFDGARVLLPLSDVPWLSALPETTATSHGTQYKRLQLEYTLQPNESLDPRAGRMLMKLLVQRSKEMVSVVHDEIKNACPEGSYGHENEWQSVCLHDEVSRILAATTNRFLVGTALC